MHPALKPKIVIDCQDTNFSSEIRAEFNEMMVDYECGQQTWFNFYLENGIDIRYPHFCQFLKENNINECIILIWW